MGYIPRCLSKITSLFAAAMRLFHQWELENLLTIINDKTVAVDDDLRYDEIEIVHKNLRKNVEFYLNNYITLMPNVSPRSVYLNIRIGNRKVTDVTKGITWSFRLYFNQILLRNIGCIVPILPYFYRFLCVLYIIFL